jgi:2-dehydropantoate 2-reductase
MRILIVGAGAVGGYFGGRLAEARRDVTFLVREARAQQLRQDGLRIVSRHGNAVLTPKIVSAKEIDTPYDLVLLSVKAFALESAMDDFAPAVGPETMILPVLNGMRHIEVLTRRFGEDAILGGACLVATEIDGAGCIIQLADVQDLTYGERAGGRTARLRALETTFGGVGFNSRLSVDIIQDMWEKWVQLAALGAATCLMRGAIGDIVAAHGGGDMSLQVLNECAAIATACGHAPSEKFMAIQAQALTTPKSPLTSSMYRDLRKGAPVEAEHILGDLLERGLARAIASPLLSAALVGLRIYQNRLSNR